MSEIIFSGRQIIAEKSERLGLLRLNRPTKLNALTSDMRADLLVAFDMLEKHADIRVIVLTGTGRGFCAGGDIDYLIHLKRSNDREGFCRILEEGTELVHRLQTSPKPIIAAINGPAVGGGLILALACDLRYAAKSALLGMPFAKIGMGPDWGGTWMLTQLIGSAKALELLLTARFYPAARAQEFGLVNEAFPDDQLIERVWAIADEIAGFAPDIIARYKHVVRAAIGGDQHAALQAERRCQLEFFDHPDFVKRISGFRSESSIDKCPE